MDTPEIVNSASKRIIKGTYSSKPTCKTSYKAICHPCEKRKGRINSAAQNAETFPKLWCQYSGATNGKIAIESKIPANGITHNIDKSPPSRVRSAG